MTLDAPETKIVPTKKVACDGDGGALGHPRVYLTMDDRGQVDCPYCDRRYILQGSPSDTAKKQ